MVIWDNIHNLICVRICSEIYAISMPTYEDKKCSFQVIEIHKPLFKSVSDFNKHNKKELSHLLLIQSWQYSVINAIKVNQIKRNFKSMDYWERRKIIIPTFYDTSSCTKSDLNFSFCLIHKFPPQLTLILFFLFYHILIYLHSSHSNLSIDISHLISFTCSAVPCLSSFSSPSAFYFTLHE